VCLRGVLNSCLVHWVFFRACFSLALTFFFPFPNCLVSFLLCPVFFVPALSVLLWFVFCVVFSFTCVRLWVINLFELLYLFSVFCSWKKHRRRFLVMWVWMFVVCLKDVSGCVQEWNRLCLSGVCYLLSGIVVCCLLCLLLWLWVICIFFSPLLILTSFFVR